MTFSLDSSDNKPPMKQIWSGRLHKMKTAAQEVVQYSLINNNGQEIKLNELVGKNLNINFSGVIECINCNKKIKKAFQQGYCFPCTQKLAACDLCMVRPERCHFDKGTCREPDWALKECFQPHYVYLANSTGLKVGITRESQVPTRWMDQGATQALVLFKVKDRKTSGLVEQEISKLVNDKSDWRKLITSHASEIDLVSEGFKFINTLFPKELNIEKIDPQIRQFSYPVEEYPPKAKTINLDKEPQFTKKLLGIKAQYLLFEDAGLNVRTYAGYHISIEETV